MKIYAVVNQKGGVGKSTTVLAMGAGLTLRGHTVLFVDLDPQGNTSYALGADTKREHNAMTVLRNPSSIAEAIQKTGSGDVLPSSALLAGADKTIDEAGQEHLLRNALGHVSGRYDYCIIDTPPALGVLTINALTACDRVIIPAQADIFSLQGIEQLSETLEAVRTFSNAALVIDGILLTRYNARSILSRDIADLADQLAGNLKTKLFKAKIREAVSIREAQINQQSIYDYAPKANVTKDYEAFLNEIMGGGGRRGKKKL